MGAQGDEERPQASGEGPADAPYPTEPDAAEPAKFEVKADRSIVGAVAAGDGAKADGTVVVHEINAKTVYIVAEAPRRLSLSAPVRDNAAPDANSSDIPAGYVRELIAILEDRASRIIAEISRRYRCESAKDRLKQFEDLHRKHVESLTRGELIRAHELLQTIHRLLYELEDDEAAMRRRAQEEMLERVGMSISYCDDPRAASSGPMICTYVRGIDRDDLGEPIRRHLPVWGRVLTSPLSAFELTFETRVVKPAQKPIASADAISAFYNGIAVAPWNKAWASCRDVQREMAHFIDRTANRLLLKVVLTDLDLSFVPELGKIRDKLIDSVQSAKATGDPVFDIELPDEMSQEIVMLVSRIRTRAAALGVDVRDGD